MKKVPRLDKNSKIAVVSPSWGGPATYPAIYKLGIENLKKQFGFEIKEYPTTRGDALHNYQCPEERADDLIAAFSDKSVDGIICSIGGDDSIRLLKYLDRHEFSPKFFMGYSDSTVLLNYFNQRGFCTFHGPALMAGFAYPKNSNQEFVEHVKSFLIENWEIYTYKPYAVWTNKLVDWENPESIGVLKNQNKNTGWKLLNKPDLEEISGILWGGCIEVLEFTKGTKYWPKEESFWKDKILMLEFSDENTTEIQIKWMLRNYGIQGVFNNIQGLLIGRFANITEKQSKQLEKIILDVVKGEFSSNIPIIANIDFGHTYPQQIFPLGMNTKIMLQGSGISILVDNPFDLSYDEK